MPIPTILPHFPEDSQAYRQSIHGKFSMTLDDSDSSVVLKSLNCSSYFGDASYNLIKEISDVRIANFNDTGANPNKDRSVIASFSGGEITLSVDANNASFNNCVLTQGVSEKAECIAFTAAISIPSFSSQGANLLEYYPSSDFTGVSLGIYDFSTKRAICLFFLDNGRIDIAGPSLDGVGTRVHNIVNHPWETGDYIYSIFVNYEENLVTITTNTAESLQDTLLLAAPLTDFGTCLSSCSFIGYTAEGSNQIFSFISQDGRAVGDTVVIKDFCLYNKGVQVIYRGDPTRNVKDFVLDTKEGLASANDLSPFFPKNVVLTKKNTFTEIKFSELTSYLYRPYSSLISDVFFFSADMFIETLGNRLDLDYAGVEIEISGTKTVRLSFLDNQIGILKNSSTDYRRASSYDTHYLDNTAIFGVLVLSDTVSIKVYLKTQKGWGTSPVINTSYQDLPNGVKDPGVYILSSDGKDPRLYIRNILVGPYSNNSVIGTTKSQETQVVTSTSTTYTVNQPIGNVYSVKPHEICAEFVTLPNYSFADSGISCLLSATIAEDSTLTYETEAGPFACLYVGNQKAIQLCMVKSNDGILYFYFPGDSQDYREVAYQTNKGKSISFEKPDGKFTLFFRYSIRNGIEVFNVDDNMNLLLAIPWDNVEGSFRLLPNPNAEGYYLPSLDLTGNYFTAAVGILNLQATSISMTVSNFIVSIGRGASVSYFLSDKVNLESLYGSRSRSLVTIEDND